VERQTKDNSVGDEFSEIQPLKIYHNIKKPPILEITFEKMNYEIEEISNLKVFSIESLLKILHKATDNFEGKLVDRKIGDTKENIYDKKVFNWYNQMRELLRLHNPEHFKQLYREEKKGGRKNKTRKKKRKYKKRCTKKNKKCTKKNKKCTKKNKKCTKKNKKCTKKNKKSKKKKRKTRRR